MIQSLSGYGMRVLFLAVNAWVLLWHLRQVIRFRHALGYWPNPALPRSYNEKVLWRKVFDRNPAFGDHSDKLKARLTFASLVPDVKLARLLWQGKRPEHIPAQVLTGDVVVKTNHGSGFNIFIRDGQHDRSELIARLDRWLKHHPYGRGNLEWGYSCIEPQVLVEEWVRCATGEDPVLATVHVCSGQPVVVWVGTGGASMSQRTTAMFAPDGSRVSHGTGKLSDPRPSLPADFSLPAGFDHAVSAAARLSAMLDLDYVRVDFMLCGSDVYGQEFTFYSLAGLSPFEAHIDERISDAWDLGASWFLRTPQRGWRGWYATALRRRLDVAGQPSP